MKKNDRRATAAVAALACLTTVGLLVGLGPLDPPTGPVAPTGKTISEAEPRTAISSANTPGDVSSVFKITTAGSYYLTGNVTFPAGKSGIEINASGVTLDLNGFQVTGSGGVSAITTSSILLGRITISNGLLFGGTGAGISLGIASGVTVEGVSVDGAGGRGIDLGPRARVRSCTVTSCNTDGIRVGEGSRLVGCTVTGTSGTTSAGFRLARLSTADACTAADNAGSGFYLLGAVLTDSVSGDNDQGINALSGSVVRACQVTDNDRTGISVGQNSRIIDNTCAGNGLSNSSANIDVGGISCRIEGNSCTDGYGGIRVAANGNYIVRNTCASNVVNWSATAGSIIYVVEGITNTTFNGDFGGTSPGTANPWANFTFGF